MIKLFGNLFVASVFTVTCLLISNNSYADPSTYEYLNSGRQTVATAGTRIQLSSTSTPCTRVVITAETDNTGIIVVGGPDVVAALATRRGIPLSAGDSITLLTNNLTDIYLDTTVNTDGVTFAYYI